MNEKNVTDLLPGKGVLPLAIKGNPEEKKILMKTDKNYENIDDFEYSSFLKTLYCFKGRRLDGLTHRQLLILMFCERDIQTNTSIAEALNICKSVVTRACDRLEELGLIVRQNAPFDGRSKLVILSQKGRQIVIKYKLYKL